MAPTKEQTRKFMKSLLNDTSDEELENLNTKQMNQKKKYVFSKKESKDFNKCSNRPIIKKMINEKKEKVMRLSKILKKKKLKKIRIYIKKENIQQKI